MTEEIVADVVRLVDATRPYADERTLHALLAALAPVEAAIAAMQPEPPTPEPEPTVTIPRRWAYHPEERETVGRVDTEVDGEQFAQWWLDKLGDQWRELIFAEAYGPRARVMNAVNALLKAIDGHWQSVIESLLDEDTACDDERHTLSDDDPSLTDGERNPSLVGGRDVR